MDENIKVIAGEINLDIPTVRINDFRLKYHSHKIINIEGSIFLPENYDWFYKTSDEDIYSTSFYVVDATGCITVHMYISSDERDKLRMYYSKGRYVGIQISTAEDPDTGSFEVCGIYEADPPATRQDNCELKRIELHTHSKMSEMDGISSPREILRLAASWGHKACAITDHGSVQGFPEFYDAAKAINRNRADEDKIKAILGCEVYLVNDGPTVFYNLHDNDTAIKEFVTLAITTDGDDPCINTFSHIAASKYRLNGFWEHVADFYAEVEDKIYTGTGEPCESYFRMGELCEFIGDAYISGENIFHTLSFLRRAGFGVDIEEHKYYRHKFLMPAISIEDIRKFAPPKASKRDIDGTGYDLIGKARADAAYIIDYLEEQECIDPHKLNEIIGHKDTDYIKSHQCRPNHTSLLARNSLGVYNLYHLLSESSIHYFRIRPRTPKSLLKYYSSSLLIGSACEYSEIYRAVKTKYIECDKDPAATLESLSQDPDMKDLISLYDYIEIQPLCNYKYLTKREPPLTEEEIKNINILLADIAGIFGKPLVATSDSHFLNKEDKRYRKTLLKHLGFSDADLIETEDLYFRNTLEMLDEFLYLGTERAYDAVIKNTNLIADKIEFGVKPFPDGVYNPIIPEADTTIKEAALSKAHEIYGHNGSLDPAVKERLDTELTSIIENDFASYYYLAYRFVSNAKKEGHIVNSRGASGSSLTAYLLGITNTNPLKPHYHCPNCNYTEFETSGSYNSGFDLPVSTCPKCNAITERDGHDIPFECFAGLYKNKEPYFDLNISESGKDSFYKYAKKLFGEDQVYKAGTIRTYGEKSALDIAREICEGKNIEYNTGDLYYMSRGIIGVKKTTATGPTLFVIVPREMDICEFTPVQFAGDNPESQVVITHLNIYDLHDTLLRQDSIAPQGLSLLQKLQKITGADTNRIPLTDPELMNIFKVGKNGVCTEGLPEFTNPFTLERIKELKPKIFFELVQILGLAHGTGTWNDNAENLIINGICDLSSVIALRDNIMTYLISKGLDVKDAYHIMEYVRKGKAARDYSNKTEGYKWEAYADLMREFDVPEWYIESCQKIRYMFPKAHAVEYTIMAFKLAWFKVYYPAEFYSNYFTMKGLSFNYEHPFLINDKYLMPEQTELIRSVDEMYQRGIVFAPIDINASHATEYTVVGDNLILPPLTAVSSIPKKLANSIARARNKEPIKYKKDHPSLSHSALKALEDRGLLDGMPNGPQMDLFSLIDGSLTDEEEHNE